MVTFVAIAEVRPGQGASLSSPAILCSRDRPHQSVTMRGAKFRVAAIDFPSATSDKMRMRSTTGAAIGHPRANCSSFRRTSASITMGELHA
jgi:hypothetical protein